MDHYAKDTSVSVEKSRAEIERILDRYGASQFGYLKDESRGLAQIMFSAHDRQIRFLLKYPNRNSDEFVLTPTGKERSDDLAYKAWEQACRQRWRALALCIKAKL